MNALRAHGFSFTQLNVPEGHIMTARNPRPAGTTRKVTLTLQSVDKKATTVQADLAPIKARVTSLEDKVGAFDTATGLLTSPHVKGGLVRTNKGMERSHKRITALSEALHGRLDVLQQAIESAQIGGAKSFMSALRDAQVDDDTINRTLLIVRTENVDTDLTDAELFTELFTAFVTVQNDVRRHTMQINDLTQVVGEHTVQITDICAQQEEGFTTIRQELHAATTTPKTGLIAGAVLGLIAAFLWYQHDFHQKIGFTVGSQFGSSDLRYKFLNSGLCALLVGLLVGALAMLVFTLFSKSSSSTTSTSSTSSNRRSSFFSRTRGSRSTQQTQTAPVATTAPVAAPAPAPATVALPAPVR
jgi:hypothetical protein